MSKPEQPQGNFKMNLNFKRRNDQAPAITGRVSTPEDPDTEFDFEAFEKTDKDGAVYWIGPVKTHRSLRQALHSQPERGTNFITIRENGFKTFKDLPDGAANPAYAALTAEERAKHDALPAYWGAWTRTPELPRVAFAAWEREPNRYGPWASGTTQYPMTKDQAAALARGDAPVETLSQPEEPASAPRKGSRRTAGGRAD